MAIQSSINSLLSQAQRLATLYVGYGKAKQIVEDQAKAAGEAETQTEIAAGNAPKTPEGKVDPEWLQKRREQYMVDNNMFRNTGELTGRAVMKAKGILSKKEKGEGISLADRKFMEDPRVQEYLKSFNENTAAKVLANKRVVERTDSINQAKSDFDDHIANLIKEYGKGSERP